MSTFLITPNMNLPNPVPGVDPGPDYATNIQSSLNQIDQHNHSAGQGLQIQPNGLNISSDLPFNGNNAISLRSVRFVSQPSPIPNAAPDVGIIYISGNELWYNDYTGGNQVQLTSNGLINATSSGISSGTSTASFSAGTLVVKSSAFSFANVDLQSVILANAGNLVNQLTLQAPILSSSYTLSLPYIPGQTNVMILDISGNMGSITYDAVGQAMSSVGADAIGVSMTSVGANAVGSSITSISASAANAIANDRTRATGTTVGAGGVAISNSCGNYSASNNGYVPNGNLTVIITTTGRPVFVGLISDGQQIADSGFGIESGRTGGLGFTRSGVSGVFAGYTIQNPTPGTGSTLYIPSSSFNCIDTPSAGTYTYQATMFQTGGTYNLLYCRLIAYEL